MFGTNSSTSGPSVYSAIDEKSLDPELLKYLKSLGVGKPARTIEYLSTLYKITTNKLVWNNFKVIQNIKTSLIPKEAFQTAYVNREGGTCRLLNLGFYYIAEQLGFQPTLLSAFARATDDWKMEGIKQESHMVNLIKFDGKQYVFDPGWGSNPREKLPLNGEEIQDDISMHRIKEVDEADAEETRYAVQKKIKDTWITQYDFSLTPRKPEYFQAHLEYVYTDFPYNGKTFAFGRAPGKVFVFSGGDHIKEIRATGKSINHDLKEIGVKQGLIDILHMPKAYVDKIDFTRFKASAQEGLKEIWEPNASAGLHL